MTGIYRTAAHKRPGREKVTEELRTRESPRDKAAELGGRSLKWRHQRRGAWKTGRRVALSVFCAILMSLSIQLPTAKASGTGGSGGSSLLTGNSPPDAPIPYYLAASQFPQPGQVPAVGFVTMVSASPLPGSIDGYASAYATVNGSGGILWFSQGSYDPARAAEIAQAGSCGSLCGQVPLAWSPPVILAQFAAPVSAVRLTSIGNSLLVAASASGSTHLYEAGTPYTTWTPIGPVESGSVAGIATDPEEIVIATLATGSVIVTTLTTSGALVGQHTLSPVGSGSTGVVAAGVGLTPHGSTFLESVVFTVKGENNIQFSSSTDGSTFSAPQPIANFSTATPPSATSTLGNTALRSAGGIPGQMALSSVSSDLFVVYTTNQSGATVPATLVSGDNGSSWVGPYITSPINGSAVDPSLTVGPTGLAYVAWKDPDYGPGAVEVATYSSDGTQIASPEVVTSSSQGGMAPVTGPGIAVDGLGRPLVLWGALPANDTNGSIAFTGGYLSPVPALALTETIVATTIARPDFANPSVAGEVASFVANVNASATRAEANLSLGHLCNAQNDTALELYQLLTHSQLVLQSSSPTVCAPSLDPSPTSSPLAPSQGLASPNTFYAVYADWALESEGVPVSTSPLSTVTTVYPYSGLALSATLPSPATTSEIVNSTTESVTVTPTPYSPTAYKLAVSGTLQGWGKTVLYTCFYPTGGWAKGPVGTVTSVTSTSSSFTVNGGSAHVFSGTSAFTSAWVYDLPAYQSFTWSGTFTAYTTATTYSFDSNCKPTTTSKAGPTIGPMTVSGSFATTLSVTYGAGLITASLNSAKTAAHLSTNFVNTLPATIQASLANGTGTQLWSTSAYATSETYTFSQSSGLNQAYTFSETSTSQAGSSTSPGSPSFAYSGSGTASPETAGLYCQFNLAPGGPMVWTRNVTVNGTKFAAPYSNVNATTVEVAWYSNQSDAGFLTYQEQGSSVKEVIRGIQPTQVGPHNWSYTIEIYGLESLADYSGAYGVSWTRGCLVQEDQLSGQVPHSPTDPAFLTQDPLKVSEQDLPYDSVTHAGGGIALLWPTPVPDQGAGIRNGYLRLTNLSATLPSGKHWTETIPLDPSEITSTSATKKSGAMVTESVVNISAPLTGSAKYRAQLTINYTGKPSQSGSRDFTYHNQKSLDGLTDLEKKSGWLLHYTTAGTMTISSSLTLHSNLIGQKIVIQQGATVTTNGYSIIANVSIVNDGTIETGWFSSSPNLPNSYGGSGGGSLGNGKGGHTIAHGGSAGSGSQSAGPGSTPKGPTLSNPLLQSWWNSTKGIKSYLGGAEGGGYTVGYPGVAGLGAKGLYLQADQIVPGRIVAAGQGGGDPNCGDGLEGGGGGGGTVILAYSSTEPIPSASGINVQGGPGVQCPGTGLGSSGAGGHGNILTYPYAFAPISVVIVQQAHPNFKTFSTNGLANDFLEKAYGLNPLTVDTAGSDMLDLWNLTFDLGQVTADNATSLPGVEVWSEVNTTTWDPWGQNGTPSATGSSIGCTSASCPGNSSSVSSTLWTNSALTQFLSLPGVLYDAKQGHYLRGTVGICPAAAYSWCTSDRLLTLWGKLSWHANPLAASTPGDGVPDGARVNPLGGTALQVNITYWSATGSSSTLPDGSGVATFVHATAAGHLEYGNYTKQTYVASSKSTFSGSFVVTFPTNATQQYAQLNLTLWENTGTVNQPHMVPALQTPSIPVDLADYAAQPTMRVYDNGSTSTELAFHWQVLPDHKKAPTWIYVPTDNSTLSALPWGLKRYTGEQNFVLLVVNDTASASGSPSVSGLPFNELSSKTYDFSLAPGLNNILVPRAAFMRSPIEQALLGNTTTGVTTTTLSPLKFPSGTILKKPLTFPNGTTVPNGTNVSGWDEPVDAIFTELASQWRNESDGSFWAGRTLTSCSGLTRDYANPDCNGIELAGNSTTVGTTQPSLAGGVNTNPSLEGGHASLAIQSILTLNEGSTSDIQGLLAGLLLNVTENLTGSLMYSTPDLGTLGLTLAVRHGLANATYRNDGAFGAPVSTIPNPRPAHHWWDLAAQGWDWFWNTASGVVTGVGSIIWDCAQAASAFLGDLAAAVGRFALNVLASVRSVLEQAANVIVSALNAFWNWLRTNVLLPAFQAAISPLWNAINGYATSLVGDLNQAYAEEQSVGATSGLTSHRFWTDFGGSVFVLTLAAVIAIEIALLIVSGLTLGAGFLVGILLSAILSTLMGTLMKYASHVVPSESGPYSRPTTKMVWACAHVMNTTKVNNTVASDVHDANYTSMWKTFADVFGWTWSLFGFTLAWGSFMGAFIDPSGVVGPAVGLTLSIIGLLLAFAAVNDKSKWLSWSSMAVAGLSVAVDFDALRKPAGRKGGLFALNLLGLGGDTASFAIILVENHDHLT